MGLGSEDFMGKEVEGFGFGFEFGVVGLVDNHISNSTFKRNYRCSN